MWTALNLAPRITSTMCRPASLIYCWWILFSTFQTLYRVKCHIKLAWGTLRVVSCISLFVFSLCYLIILPLSDDVLLLSVRCLLVLVNPVINGPKKSGKFRVAVLGRFFKRKMADLTFSSCQNKVAIIRRRGINGVPVRQGSTV